MVIGWGVIDYQNGPEDPPPGLSNVVAVSSGWDHSMALKLDGTVLCWGSNIYGQCEIPVDLKDVVAVSAGCRFSMALKKDGTLVGWGDNTYGVLSVPNEATNIWAIEASFHNCVALRKDGKVFCWGSYYGTPPVGSNYVGLGINSTGYGLVIRSNGSVYCWGQLSSVRTVPSTVTNIMHSTGGYNFCIALNENGTISGWGNTSNHRLDIPFGLTNVISIDALEDNSLALCNNGTVIGWGNQTALNTIPDIASNIVYISSGYNYALIVNSTGRLNPMSDDTDMDGMKDGFEAKYGYNPFVNVPVELLTDLDNDGLSNEEEIVKGTRLDDPDTDNDGLPDEIDSDPLTYDNSPVEFVITYPTNGLIIE